MKAELECPNCNVHYMIKWTILNDFAPEEVHPLETDDDSLTELFPELCPFCGHSADES